MNKIVPILARYAFAGVLFAASPHVFAVDGKWNANAGDNWSTASRWTNNQIADGVGAVANIAFNIDANRTVTLNGNRTVGRLRFEDATTASSDWTLGVANSAVLTLQVSSGSPVLEVANRTATLNPILTGTQGFTRTGGGTLILNQTSNALTGKLVFNAGPTRIRTGSTLGEIPAALVPDQITLNGGVLMNNDSDAVVAATQGITLGASGGTLQAGWSKPFTIQSPITGSGALTIQNDTTPGVITLDGVNTYTGITRVANNTANWAILLVNGSIQASSQVLVTAKGWLGGTGAINSPVSATNLATVSAGARYKAGTLTINNSLALTNCYLAFDLASGTDVGGGVNDLIQVNGDLVLDGTITLDVSPLAGTLANGTYRLVNYTGSLLGAATFTNVPSRYSLTVDTSTPGQINLVVSGAPATLAWGGASSSDWNVGTPSNWLNGASADAFYQGDSVLFDDQGNYAATVNMIGLSNAVNTLLPAAVVVNTTNSFTLSSTNTTYGGRLGGAMSLTKQGSGTLTLSTGSGNLPNYFDGPVVISEGILRPGNARALGNITGGTYATSGGTLDVNAQNLGFEPIYAAGAGVGGLGAIVNAGAEQQNAVRFLTLSGDASIGGVNRWDVRGAGGNNSFSGLLNLDGHTLTKVGSNKIAVVDSLVTSAGDISVAGGTLSFTRSQVDGPGVISLGNAILQLENNSTGYVAKPIIANGGRLFVNGTAFSLWSPITNAAGLTVENAVDLTLTNEFTGAGSLTKVGVGILTFERPAQHSGPTTISTGSVVLAASSGIPNSTAISVGSGATLDASALPAGLTLNSGQTLGGSGNVNGLVTAGPGTALVPGTSPGTLTLNGGLGLNSALATFELGASPFTPGANDLVSVNFPGLSAAGVTAIKIVPLASLDTANPYTLFQNGGAPLPSGSEANFSVSSDSRYNFTVLPTDASGGTSVQVQVAGTGAAATLVWRGNDATQPTWWDTKTTTNWVNGATPDTFYLGDTVVFDDTAVGTTAELIGTLQPSFVLLSNVTKTITLAGAGSLVASGVNAEGAGTTTIANTAGNTLVQGVTMNDGTLVFANTAGNTLLQGVTMNAGALVFANQGVNDFGTGLNLNGGNLRIENAFNNLAAGVTFFGFPGGTLTFNQPHAATVAWPMFNTGTVVKEGTNTLSLSGANAGFSGDILVNAGVLRPTVAAALGDVNGRTIVASGAALDVNGQGLGFEPVRVRGIGPDGRGAIINNGAENQNALRNVTLTGDATFGGTVNRWDIRSDNTALPNATLSTENNAYNLTKVGLRDVCVVSATVDPALGDIDILEGVFSVEVASTSLGNPLRTMTIRSNASFRMWGNTVPLDKQLLMKDTSRFVVGSGTANTFAGPVTLEAGTAQFDIASAVSLRLSNTVAGAGNLLKVNAGNLFLSASNNLDGTYTATNGTLTLAHPDALGGSKQVTIIRSATTGGAGTRLGLVNGLDFPADVTASFFSTTNGGDFRTSIASDLGTNLWQGPILLNGSSIVGFYGNATNNLNISGPILGTNGFTGTAFFRGAATNGSYCGTISGQLNASNATMAITDGSAWTFSAGNNVWARTTVAYGRAILGVDNGLCPTAPVSLGQTGTSAGTLDLNGFRQEVPSVTTVNGLNHFIGSSSTTADSTFVFNGGTNTSVYAARIVDSVAGGTMKVGVRIVSGTLQLDGTNTHTGPTEITGGVLAGNGSLLSPVTVLAGGTLAPGASIGILSVTNTVTLGGTNVMEVSKTGGTITKDLLRGVTTLTYGGTLVLALSGDALAAGDSLKLYDATAYAGTFAAIQPATPGAGLVWDTSELATAGTLKVAPEAAPPITGISLLPDGNFALTLGGTVGQPYTVRASSDVTQPLSTWTILSSGLLPSVPFTYTDLTATNYPIRFYGTSSP